MGTQTNVNPEWLVSWNIGIALIFMWQTNPHDYSLSQSFTCLKGDWERTQGYIYSYMCTSSNLLFRDGSNTKTIQHQKEYLYCLSLVLVLGIFNAVLNNRRYKRRGVYLFLVSRGCLFFINQCIVSVLLQGIIYLFLISGCL